MGAVLRLPGCRHAARGFLGGGRSLPERKGCDAMKTLKIGIASFEDYKARTLAVARGEYVPPADGPKIWFTSLESLAKVLSEKNRALLALIARTQPASLNELAEKSSRAKSNLSRTLKTMEH